MEKQYRFRIYPTKSQEEQIQCNFGCARFVYNHFLEKRREAYEKGRGIIGVSECSRQLTILKSTDGYEWLHQADAGSLVRAIRHLDLAYKAFFRNIKRKGVAPGHPRFKSKKDIWQSYCSPSCEQKEYISKKTGEVRKYEPTVVLGAKTIKLPKLGLVECRVSKQVEGRILSATVMQAPSGKYYVSVLFTDCESLPMPQSGESVGLHPGIRVLVVTSDGEQIENQRYFDRSSKKIAKLQRRLQRKTSGSANFEKARVRLARAYESAKNQKTDFIHKLTTRLVQDYDAIYIRDPGLERLLRDPIYAKHFFDAGHGELIAHLKYKSRWYGRQFVRVDTSFPSTQFCSSCGYRNREVSEKWYLKQWDCPECGAHNQRAVNAAINVKNEGEYMLGIGIVRPGGPESKPVESKL